LCAVLWSVIKQDYTKQAIIREVGAFRFRRAGECKFYKPSSEQNCPLLKQSINVWSWFSGTMKPPTSQSPPDSPPKHPRPRPTKEKIIVQPVGKLRLDGGNEGRMESDGGFVIVTSTIVVI